MPRWVFLQKTAAAALVSALSKRMLPSCKMCFARPKSSASESYWFIYPVGEFSSNNENDSSKKKISLRSYSISQVSFETHFKIAY